LNSHEKTTLKISPSEVLPPPGSSAERAERKNQKARNGGQPGNLAQIRGLLNSYGLEEEVRPLAGAFVGRIS
jgi:hypothetical protein